MKRIAPFLLAGALLALSSHAAWNDVKLSGSPETGNLAEFAAGRSVMDSGYSIDDLLAMMGGTNNVDYVTSGGKSLTNTAALAEGAVQDNAPQSSIIKIGDNEAGITNIWLTCDGSIDFLNDVFIDADLQLYGALYGPADPVAGNQVGDRDYNDARYAPLSPVDFVTSGGTSLTNTAAQALATNALQQVSIDANSATGATHTANISAVGYRVDALDGNNVEYKRVDSSLNMINLYPLIDKIRNKDQLRVFVISDGWGAPSEASSGPPIGIVRDLIDQFGYAGSWSPWYYNGLSDVNPASYAGSPTVRYQEDTDWVGYATKLNGAGDMVRFSTTAGPTKYTKYGLNWVAGPSGGDFTILQGPYASYTPVMTVSGYAATPTYMSTNWIVADTTEEIVVSNNTASVNMIINAYKERTAGPGVVFFESWYAGPMTRWVSCSNVVHDAIADFDPDLILWSFADIGQIDEATYRDYMENLMPYMLNAGANAEVVLLGIPYNTDPTLSTDQELEEKLIRDYAVSNFWAYYDVKRTAGSHTNVIEQGFGSATDPDDMYTKQGAKAYGWGFINASGLSAVRTEPSYGAITDTGPLTPVYSGQTNQLAGFADSYDSGTITTDRPGATITTTAAGLYEFYLSVENTRDAATIRYWLVKDGTHTSTTWLESTSPTSGFNYSTRVRSYSGADWTVEAASSATTYMTNVVFYMELIE